MYSSIKKMFITYFHISSLYVRIFIIIIINFRSC